MPHNFNSIQFASQGKKYGSSNPSHVLGVKTVRQVLEEMKYITEIDFPISDQSFYWEYDVIAFLPFPDLETTKEIKFIIEIDGEKHSSMINKIKDGVAKDKALRHYPKAKFFRFNKYDCRPEYKNWLKEQLSK